MVRTERFVHLNSRSNGGIVQLQSALNDDYNNFSGEIKHVPNFLEPIIGRFFPNLVLVRSFRNSFIDSFSSAKGTLQSSSEPSFRTEMCVYPRAFMTLRVAQFSLKIAHLSFLMGPRGTPRLRSPSPTMAPGCLTLFRQGGGG